MKTRNLIGATMLLVLFTVFAIAQTPTCASQRYVYSQNDTIPNSIQGFCIEAGGVLSTLPGSPFATGGDGLGLGWIAANRAVVTSNGSRLYVSNDGSGTISGFDINRETGQLTAISGSPWTMPGNNGAGTSFAATPDGTTIFVGRYNGIASFSIDPSTGSVTGTNFIETPHVNGLVISPDGALLVPVYSDIGSFAVLSIIAGGGLEQVGTDYYEGNSTSGVFSADGTKFYLASYDGDVKVFQVSSGAFTSLQSFGTDGAAPQVLVLHPNQTTMYGASPQEVLWSFTLDSSGLITGKQVEEIGRQYTSLAMSKNGENLFVKGIFDKVGSYLSDTSQSVTLTAATGNPFGSFSAGMSVVVSEPPACSDSFSIQINPPSSGTVNLSLKAGSQAVALISSCAVDTVTGLNLSSARFAGASPITNRNSLRKEIYDVNGDGVNDVVLFFNIKTTNLNKFSTQATLTVNGISSGTFSASQSVRMVAR